MNTRITSLCSKLERSENVKSFVNVNASGTDLPMATLSSAKTNRKAVKI